ncbi:hypothetical protein CEXT_101381 [Caerostris extrusa]|uniref:Uncharacterized protein n=1 Tax=Caerostris extrusa TaxID=172846 RepID=A0AAV4MMM7_CAEEX|nr:hypothetical protein CEXT_101381 [Caerostris extrusa]
MLKILPIKGGKNANGIPPKGSASVLDKMRQPIWMRDWVFIYVRGTYLNIIMRHGFPWQRTDDGQSCYITFGYLIKVMGWFATKLPMTDKS